MQCVKCGAGNRQQARFCEECGTPLALACPQCGVPIIVGKKFCSDCGAALFAAPLASSQLSSPHSPASYTPPHLASRILSGKSALEGERKIITVLFADIKGSMDILEGLDPEVSKRLLDPCIQLMMDAVHRAEGTVSRVLGDGIMALFGAPLAQEDHPHRALYAALRMQEAVRRYAEELRRQHDSELQIRVGVNTGEVVVGAIGNDLFMEYTPVGHAVGLAARMETLAAPGSTFITASTYHLTEHAFRFISRGVTKVKGAKEPLAIYELLSPDPSHSRLTARTASGLSPFVGRARELTQLEEFAAKAASGHGQVVLLTGEAGIGKSRLLEELKRGLQKQGFLLIEGAGFAYGKTRAYLPLIDMLKRYCGITDQDSPAAYQDKLQTALTNVHDSLTSFAPIFLDLLGVTNDDPAVANLSAEAKLKQILDGVKQLIALQCRLQPVALLIEDLHWLDARSLTFLHFLMASTAALPVLLLCSSRPGYAYSWGEQSFIHKMQLEPLPPDILASLFTALVGAAANGIPLASVICERSGGNPFFLEEIVQNLRETGALVESATAKLPTAMVPRWALPPTVQGVLASRLDRLPPPAKSLLQTASVIGREAPRLVLAQVAAMPEAEFEHALHLLETRELLYESALYPDSIYSFKHALTQEVAYHGLLHEPRMALHERVGNAMEAIYADKLPEYVSLLAYHYHHSANSTKALYYLDLAGRRASSLYADGDAQYFWEGVLRLLATQPHAPERDRQEIRTRLHLINVLSRQHNDDAPIRTQFAATEAVCRRVDDAHLLAELHATLAVAYILRGQPRTGLPHARAAKAVADAQRNVHLQAITAGPLAHLLWIAGSFTEARQIAEDGLELIQQHQFAWAQMGFIIHPHAHCLAIAGVCRGFLGEFEQGVRALREAAELTERHSNRMPQAVVHWGLALLFDLYEQQEQAKAEIAKALSIMEEVSPTTGVLLVGSLHDYLAASTAHDLAVMPSSHLMRTWQERLPFCELAGAWFAELIARDERKEEARQLAREALQKAEESASTWFLCAVHLTNGRLLASGADDTKQAAGLHLRTAFDLATRMRSLPLLAHAAVELGDLLLKNGKPAITPEQSSETSTTKHQDAQRNQAKRYLQQAIELGEQLKMATLCERARRLLVESAQ
ncbi:MAG: adenylate/guanylate cyclase domain-containing protein [Candidatus Binatia bacterium]